MADPKPPLREIFEAVVGLAPAARAAHYDTVRLPAGDRDAVERMIAADSGGDGHLLDRSFDQLLSRIGQVDGERSELPAGAEVGPFRLIEKLGEGGASIVYRAEREQSGVRQPVALKLLRRGLYSADEQRQFRAERRALVQLRHSGIARLIEGGVTDAGMPYIALELIDGQPITDYARAHALGIEARLRLMVDVCRAVEAAHRALIVHRDIKPSNVLVTHDGEVKLVDFGIAKLLEPADGDGEDTRTLVQAMTPAYAAPEQFAHGPITTATDVYALGVLLGELMTGTRRRAGDSHTPSSSIEATEPGVLPAAPAIVRRQLRGDLDNIVMKATAEEPDRRYASAGALAEDIERHLGGRPVAAHPPSSWYRASKFVLRHKGSVATTATVALAIVAALGIALWQAAVARAEAARAEAVRAFLVGVFEQAEPDARQGTPITAHKLLEIGETELAEKGRDQPVIRADLTALIGHLYWNVGDYERAEALLRRAADASLAPGMPDDIRARAFGMLAAAEAEKHDTDRAIADARKALDYAARAGIAAEPDASAARRALVGALIAKGNAADGEKTAREALAADLARGEAGADAVARDWLLIGRALDQASRYPESESALRSAIALARARRGDVSSVLCDAYNYLGLMLWHKGDLKGAEDALRRNVALAERIYGPRHRETLSAKSTLLVVMEDQGRIEESLAERLRLLDIDKTLADTRPDQLANDYNLIAYDYQALGRLGDAEQALRDSIATYARLGNGADPLDSVGPYRNLAIILEMEGKFDDAEPVFARLIELAEAHYPKSSHDLNSMRGDYGNFLRLDHRTADALRVLDTAVKDVGAGAGAPDPDVAYLMSQLAEAELDAGDADKARATGEAALAMARKVLPAKDHRIATSLYALARAELAQDRATQALAHLREALELRRATYKPDDIRVVEVEVDLCAALARTGAADDAAKLRASVAPILAKSPSPYARDLAARLTASR